MQDQIPLDGPDSITTEVFDHPSVSNPSNVEHTRNRIEKQDIEQTNL